MIIHKLLTVRGAGSAIKGRSKVPEEPKKFADVMPGQTIQPSSSQPEPAQQAAPAPQTAPEANVNPSNIPKFGELQAKVDEHPLFSGSKEPPAPRKGLLGRTLWPVLALVIALILLYLAVDAGLIKGYSHLPFHFFKAPVAKTTPVITPAKTTSQKSATTTPDPYAGWKTYTSKYVSFSFKYPSDWTVRNGTTTSNMSKDQESIEIDSPVSSGYYFALSFNRGKASNVAQNFLGNGPGDTIASLPGKYLQQSLLLVAVSIRQQTGGLSIATSNTVPAGASLGISDPAGTNGVNNITFSANLIAQGSSSVVNQTQSLSAYQTNGQYQNLLKIFESINE